MEIARTTLRLDEHLMRQARQIAAETGRTLTAVVEDALREAIYRQQHQAKEARKELPTFSSELMPGVDLNNSASLLDMMEEDDAPL